MPANCIPRWSNDPDCRRAPARSNSTSTRSRSSSALPAPRVSPFPAVFQDLSLVVDDDVAAQAVIDAVRDGAGELLEDVALFDVYTGPQIGEGRKSLTLALRFRAADRTLTEDEASAARDAALAAPPSGSAPSNGLTLPATSTRETRKPRAGRFGGISVG